MSPILDSANPCFFSRMKGLSGTEVWYQRMVPVLSEAMSFPTLGSLLCIVSLIISFILSDSSSTKSKKVARKAIPDKAALFPSISQTSATLKACSSSDEDLSIPQPCSTGLTTRLLPFKNDKGEIEWVLTEDNSEESSMDAFKHNPKVSRVVKSEDRVEILSPVTSNSSNNDSLNGNKSPTVQTSTPSSTFSEDRLKDDEAGDGEGAHQCPHCDAKFRMRGYLTRHLKKHSLEKAYKCPFHKSSIYKDEKDQIHQCHPNGAFSRRDTYKTHLKTRHFKYPEGTCIKDRPNSDGKCSMCGDWFQNAEIWSEIHIEGHECRYLPEGFKGKSRIKNRLKKQMHRMMKAQKKHDRRGCGEPHPRSVSPALSTPNSIDTPALSTSMHEVDSPTQSVSPSTVSNMPSSINEHPQRPLYFGQDSPALIFNPPSHDFATEEDYGDEFCLDTEQMGFPGSFPNNFSPANGHSMRQFQGYAKVAPTYMSQYIH